MTALRFFHEKPSFCKNTNTQHGSAMQQFDQHVFAHPHLLLHVLASVQLSGACRSFPIMKNSWTNKKYWGGTVKIMIKWHKKQSGTSWTDKKLWKHHMKLVKARMVAMEQAHFQATQQVLEFLAANPLYEEQTCQREKCPNVHRNATLYCSKACLDMGAMLTKLCTEQKELMSQTLICL